jgi:hypothetical protein
MRKVRLLAPKQEQNSNLYRKLQLIERKLDIILKYLNIR